MMRALSARVIRADFTEHNTNQIGEADYRALAFHSVSNVFHEWKSIPDFRGAPLAPVAPICQRRPE